MSANTPSHGCTIRAGDTAMQRQFKRYHADPEDLATLQRDDITATMALPIVQRLGDCGPLTTGVLKSIMACERGQKGLILVILQCAPPRGKTGFTDLYTGDIVGEAKKHWGDKIEFVHLNCMDCKGGPATPEDTCPPPGTDIVWILLIIEILVKIIINGGVHVVRITLVGDIARDVFHASYAAPEWGDRAHSVSHPGGLRFWKPSATFRSYRFLEDWGKALAPPLYSSEELKGIVHRLKNISQGHGVTRRLFPMSSTASEGIADMLQTAHYASLGSQGPSSSSQRALDSDIDCVEQLTFYAYHDRRAFDATFEQSSKLMDAATAKKLVSLRKKIPLQCGRFEGDPMCVPGAYMCLKAVHQWAFVVPRLYDLAGLDKYRYGCPKSIQDVLTNEPVAITVPEHGLKVRCPKCGQQPKPKSDPLRFVCGMPVILDTHHKGCTEVTPVVDGVPALSTGLLEPLHNESTCDRIHVELGNSVLTGMQEANLRTHFNTVKRPDMTAAIRAIWPGSMTQLRADEYGNWAKTVKTRWYSTLAGDDGDTEMDPEDPLHTIMESVFSQSSEMMPEDADEALFEQQMLSVVDDVL